MPVPETDFRRIWPPRLVWGIILAVISATEFGLMFALPLILPERPSRVLESAADSLLLTLVLSPVIWWTVVRPLRESARLRERFLADLFTAMEDERRRIAMEIHDGVGQSLTLLVSGLRFLKDYTEDAEISRRGGELRDLADRALKDAKQLSLNLRPSMLDDLGLAPAINRIVADVRQLHALAVSVDVDSAADRRLPAAVETALFRICQEALANIVRHAKATQTSIRLEIEHNCVILEVTDNGCGIDSRQLEKATVGHLGLLGMRERAALLGGELRIDSTVGRGTRIIARIPIERATHG